MQASQACSPLVGRAGKVVPNLRGVGGPRRTLAVRASRADRPDEQLEWPMSGRRQALVAGGALAASLLLPTAGGGAAQAADAESIYDLSALMYGEEVPLSKYKGQALLVLNVASARALYDKYRDQGFNIVAFPCNQFGGQAPGSSQEEREWAWRKFGFEFDVFDKLEVNGAGTHPIYQILKRQQPISLPSSSAAFPGEPGRIEWNYTKFLVDRDGVARKRFKPGFDPLEFEGDVRLLLAGRDPLPAECIMHPGRKVCKVETLLEG